MNVRMMGSFLLLIHTDVLTTSKASILMKSCESVLINEKITKNDFISTEMWLDEDEKAVALTRKKQFFNLII